MGKIKALVTEMGSYSAKKHLEKIKRKLEKDNKKGKQLKNDTIYSK
tara:strand:+ start:330 stop:467 length:138 start_codon:yes stop_codon:yes gene_type:complete